MRRSILLSIAATLVITLCSIPAFASSTKISGRGAATTPVTGSETIGIIQSSTDRKVTIASLGVPIVVAKSGVPFIKASSGTMGNNCAISAMTTLTKTYSGGAYLYLPADAIEAGSAAGWYWFVGSSATAGTCYNNTYSSGTPTVPSSPTAFSTTGPGAFTGVTGAISGPTLTIPGGLMGIDGRALLHANHTAGASGSGSSKTFQITFGGTNCTSIAGTSATTWLQNCQVQNRGVANRQGYLHWYMNSSGTAATITFPADSTIDTTADVSIVFNINTALATDFGTIDSYSITVNP